MNELLLKRETIDELGRVQRLEELCGGKEQKHFGFMRVRIIQNSFIVSLILGTVVTLSIQLIMKNILTSTRDIAYAFTRYFWSFFGDSTPSSGLLFM